MKRLLWLIAGSTALAFTAGASQLCTDVTSQNIVGLNCTVGGLTFSNFQVVAAAGNLSPEIDLSSVNVAADGSVTLAFNPHMSTQPGGGAQDAWVYYQVDGGINQLGVTVNGTNSTVMETACDTPIAMTGQFANICQGNLLGNFVAFGDTGPNSASSGVFSMTPTVYVFKDVGVLPEAPNAGGGAMTSFSQTFSGGTGGGGSGSGAEVPEPNHAGSGGAMSVGACFFAPGGRRQLIVHAPQ